MSVKLRFRRMGRKQHPVFGLVATDARSPRDGRFIEDLGRYEPVTEPARVKFNADRILYWLGQGAQPSDTVRNLLQKEGILMRWSMTRAGASAEEIETAVEEFKARRAEKAASTGKKTRAEHEGGRFCDKCLVCGKPFAEHQDGWCKRPNGGAPR